MIICVVKYLMYFYSELRTVLYRFLFPLMFCCKLRFEIW